MLKIEQSSFWFPWKTATMRVPIKRCPPAPPPFTPPTAICFFLFCVDMILFLFLSIVHVDVNPLITVYSVLPGVQPMKDPRSGETMVDRMMFQMDTHTQVLMFRGKFHQRDLFDQINAGSYIHGAK